MDSEKKRIKQSNDSILSRLKRGESLATVPPEATWFPPRPLIEKDLSKLYSITPKSPLLSLVTNDGDGIYASTENS